MSAPTCPRSAARGLFGPATALAAAVVVALSAAGAYITAGQATRPAVLGGLRSLAARTSPKGTAVFMVATHSSTTSFRTVEGARIQRYEVASLLGQVHGRLWSLFAVCYAGAYNVPGVTGP